MVAILYIPYSWAEDNSGLMDQAIAWQEIIETKNQTLLQDASKDEFLIVAYGEIVGKKLKAGEKISKIYILGHGFDSVSSPEYSAHISNNTNCSEPTTLILPTSEVARRFEETFSSHISADTYVKLYFCNPGRSKNAARGFIDGLSQTNFLRVEYYNGSVTAPHHTLNFHKAAYVNNSTYRASLTRQTLFHHKLRFQNIDLKTQTKRESSEKLKQKRKDIHTDKARMYRQTKVANLRLEALALPDSNNSAVAPSNSN